LFEEININILIADN